jgi:hypothetical protein
LPPMATSGATPPPCSGGGAAPTPALIRASPDLGCLMSPAASDPIEDGAEPAPELIVGEIGRGGGRVLGHGRDQPGEAFGVRQPQ